MAKLKVGSKIWNADTQTDVGTILHDGSLKTVNGVSLVGSGDAPVGAKFLGALAGDGTLSSVVSDEYLYYIIIFNTSSGGGEDLSAIFEGISLTRVVTVVGIGLTTGFDITIGANGGGIEVSAIGDDYPCKIYGVKGVS